MASPGGRPRHGRHGAVTFSLTNNAGATAAFIPAGNNTCTITNGLGTCTIDFTSPTPGNVDVSATTTFSVGGVSLTRTTGDGLLGDGPRANKVFVAGSIIIRKITVPAGGTGFNFATSANLSPSSFSLDDGPQRAYNNLAPGAYSVDELAKVGWDLTALSCTGDAAGGTATTTDLNTGVASIGLDAGETITCTYTNTQRARLIVEKQTNPAGRARFDFTGAATGAFILNDDGNKPVGNLVPGDYTVTELAEAGWDLTSIVCNDGDSSGVIATGIATFRLQPGETVKCTFTNTQRGKIEIVKHTEPAGGIGFEFTGGEINTTLNDGGLASKDNLLPGVYTVTESVKNGWDLSALQCNDGGSATEHWQVGTRTATFRVTQVRPSVPFQQRAARSAHRREADQPADGAGFDFIVRRHRRLHPRRWRQQARRQPRRRQLHRHRAGRRRLGRTSVACNDSDSSGVLGPVLRPSGSGAGQDRQVHIHQHPAWRRRPRQDLQRWTDQHHPRWHVVHLPTSAGASVSAQGAPDRRQHRRDQRDVLAGQPRNQSRAR